MRDPIILATLSLEGGTSGNAADRGGYTRFGITKPFLSEDIGRPATDYDIAQLTEGLAYDVYARFMDRTGIGKIANDKVRGEVFDAAVNHGLGAAVRLLQRALGVSADGVLGTKTLTAVPYLDGTRLALRVLAQRARLYGRIVTGNLVDADHDGIPDNTEMDAGWMNRLAWRLEQVF